VILLHVALHAQVADHVFDNQWRAAAWQGGGAN
jgi:hypothetical protein